MYVITIVVKVADLYKYLINTSKVVPASIVIGISKTIKEVKFGNAYFILQ